MKNKVFRLLILLFCISLALFAVSCKKGNKDSAKESKRQSAVESVVESETAPESICESQTASESIVESDEESSYESEIQSEEESEIESESESESEMQSEMQSETESESESVHECDYVELKYNETHHWYECTCGKKDVESEHTGGSATCQELAKCSTCGQSYGEYSTHNMVDGECTVCGAKESQGLEFELNEDQISYTVVGMGTCTDNDLIIPATYNSLPVTSIGIEAFKDCINLTSVVIPNSVTTIGDSAFYCCYKLVEVINNSSHLVIEKHSPKLGDIGYYALSVSNCDRSYESKISHDNGYIIYTEGEEKILLGYNGTEKDIILPNYITQIYQRAFYNLDSLTSVEIGDSVTKIGHYAFYKCYNLTSVEIGDHVTTIGESAFSTGSNLISVYYNGDVEGWCNITFSTFYSNPLSHEANLYIDNEPVTELVIPNTVTEIKAYAFSGCAGLTSVVIGDNVTTIAKDAFYKCFDLTEITLPFVGGTKDGTTNTHFGYIFGASSYSDHSSYVPKSLTKVTITSATTIGEDAFRFCYHLTSIEIPDSVTTIGGYAFQNCSNLTSIIIGDSVTTIGREAFSGCKKLANVYYNGKIEGWCDITHEGVYLTSNPLYYGANFYIDDKLVTELVIPDTVSEIKGRTFCFYKKLTSVVIGDSVTSIGDYAFRNCDSLTSVVLGENVKTIGKMAFNGCDSLPSVEIPNKVRVIGSAAFACCTSLTSIEVSKNNTAYKSIDGNLYSKDGTSFIQYAAGKRNSKFVTLDGVTTIGGYAFDSCPNLTSVVIGDNVTKIDKYAFLDCSALTEITLPFVGETKDGVTNTHFGYIFGASSYSDNSSYVPASLTNVTITSATAIGNIAFYECSNLTSIEIPASVTTIGGYAFEYCSNLPSIEIPASVTAIGYGAFSECKKLANVYYSGSIEGWCNITFTSEYSNPLVYGANLYVDDKLVTELAIPNTVIEIKDYVFYNCSSLTSVVVEDSVKTIGESAFQSCDNLANVAIGEGVTTIGSSAFYKCSGLESLIIGNSVETINMYAFSECSSLKNVEIPDSLTNIGIYAFADCESLASVDIPDGVTSIGSYAFYSCESLTSVVIGDNVAPISDSRTTIGESAFFECSNLTSVVIGDNVTAIGKDAFRKCFSLTSVAIGDSVTIIYENAFFQCESLISVVIGNSVTTIWNSAFAYCTSLTSVVIGEKVVGIGERVFYDCYRLVEVINNSSHITVEKGSEDRGYIGYYALSVSNCDESYESRITNDNGYIIYTEGEEKLLVCYVGEETKLVLPDCVTQIYKCAFFQCKSLISVVIPDSVTTIGESAFEYCSNLTIIYYEGTSDEWEDISISDYNRYLINVTKYYYIENEADVPTDDGKYWHYDENGNIAIW